MKAHRSVYQWTFSLPDDDTYCEKKAQVEQALFQAMETLRDHPDNPAFNWTLHEVTPKRRRIV